jgi:RNA polymerase sigma factor for flagellar operon FliA
MSIAGEGRAVEERRKLLIQELPQVYSVAARIRKRLPRHVEMADLVQSGVIGLIDACCKYDNGKDAQFSTFAKHRIRGAILDSLRELDWGSRTLRRKGRQIASSVARLERQFGRHPSEEEIATDLKTHLDELQSTLTQLDGLLLAGQMANVSGDDVDSFDLIESAPSAGRDNPLDHCLEGEIKAQLAAVISRMSEREQRILSLYYYEEITMKEVSEVVGIGVSRVAQSHAGAILKLRASLAHLRESPSKPADRASTSRLNHGPQPETRL